VDSREATKNIEQTKIKTTDKKNIDPYFSEIFP
jgi:hypothetical protein